MGEREREQEKRGRIGLGVGRRRAPKVDTLAHRS